jgi:hypothetical protein
MCTCVCAHTHTYTHELLLSLEAQYYKYEKHFPKGKHSEEQQPLHLTAGRSPASAHAGLGEDKCGPEDQLLHNTKKNLSHRGKAFMSPLLLGSRFSFSLPWHQLLHYQKRVGLGLLPGWMTKTTITC